MAQLPAEAPARRLVKAFAKFGFVPDRQEGSHQTLKRPGPKGTITLVCPVTYRGVLRRILRYVEISNDDFMDVYNSV